MTEGARKARNRTKLTELNQWLRPKVAAIVSDLEGHGWRPRIQQGWRSPEEQRRLKREGRSRVAWGFHNATTPYGLPDALAVDVVNDDNPYSEPALFAEHLERSAKAHWLMTGRRWRTLHDPWHVQPRPETLTIAQARAGRRPT
jgi:hypothetical protein